MFTVNRIVVFLTPVFTAAAAVGTGWLSKHFPGLPTPKSGEVVKLEIAGATAALGGALMWLKGHHQYEKIIADAEKMAKVIESDAKLAATNKAASSVGGGGASA